MICGRQETANEAAWLEQVQRCNLISRLDVEPLIKPPQPHHLTAETVRRAAKQSSQSTRS